MSLRSPSQLWSLLLTRSRPRVACEDDQNKTITSATSWESQAWLRAVKISQEGLLNAIIETKLALPSAPSVFFSIPQVETSTKSRNFTDTAKGMQTLLWLVE